MYLSDSYEFQSSVKINSGNRALEHLPFELDALSSRKPFFITDKKAAEKGIVDEIIKALKGSDITIGVFDGAEADPDPPLIRDLYHIFRNKGYDALVAVGGGRIMDTAKALNIAVSGKPEDLEGYAGHNLIRSNLKPLVYMPTMSGEGLEASKYAFFNGKVYVSYFLMPDLAIIDSRIAVPEDVKTATATALAALSQSVESFISKDKNCLTDSYALASIQLIMENLVDALKNPQAKKSRVALANAHVMAACAFSNAAPDLTYLLGTIIGAEFNVHRGLPMGIILPHAMKYHKKRQDKHIGDLLLALAGIDRFAETSADNMATVSVDLLMKLQDDLFALSGGAVPRTLKEMHISKDSIRNAIQRAATGVFGDFDTKEAEDIIESAW